MIPEGDQGSVGCNADACMMMEATPSTPLVVAQAKVLFEVLIVPLDSPTQLGCFDESFD